MSESLCRKCQQFYATEKTEFLCSLCYQQHLKIKKVQNQMSHFQMPTIVPPKQADHGKCYNCHKKIGLLGFKCNSCDCSYCKNHRLPQNHQCEVDFHENAKKQIEKNNPNITASKVQKF